METGSSLPHSQVPATRLYPEPARSSPYPHIPLSEGSGELNRNMEGRALRITFSV
jgi:hypothetical protein